MGAWSTQQIGLGRDVESAYRQAYSEAEAEYGHQQGYSGAINSKDGHTAPIVLPARWKLNDFVAALSDASDDYYHSATERARHARLVRDLPTWRHHAEVYGDKWGPAVAIEITGSQATEIKARRGRAGTRDRVFAFVGLAPC